MNRLERIQLIERCDKAEARAEEAIKLIAELSSRIEALETKPRLGRPPKATDGDGQRPVTS
jgi:plasmid stabilization system protein ParE